MTLDDVSAVMAIEKRAYPFPWTATLFVDCLRHGYSGWLYEHDGKLAGYAMMMLVLLLGSKPIIAARYGPAPTATAAMVTHSAME